MRTIRWWMGWTLLAAVPGACSDSFSSSAGPAGGSGPVGPALTEVPGLYAASLCKAVNACSQSFAEVFFGPNDCASTMTKRIEQASLPLFQAAVAASTMAYDPSKVSACLEKIEAEGCRTFDNFYLEECENALGGLVELGGACAFDGECKGDAYCMTAGSCPGVCTERELRGAACGNDTDCQPSLKCFKSKCTAKLEQGASCSASEVDCKGGMICSLDTGDGRACVPLETVFSEANGKPCDIANAVWCEHGSYCAVTALSLGAATQMCVAKVEANAACNFSVGDMCPKSQYCAGTEVVSASPKIAGTCTALPTEGEACTNKGDLGKACAAGHVCVTSGTDAICHRIEENGGSCDLDKECYSEFCSGGLCAPKSDCEVKPAG